MASKSSGTSAAHWHWRVGIGFVCALCIAAGVGLWLRSGHGELGEKGHDFTVALFSACNLRDSEKIDQVARLIETAEQDGSITDSEVRWLMDIVDDTRDNRWEQASKTLRKLMNAQAVANQSLPELD